ncbi:MAG: hypothetical protein WKG06_39480 [Segetibacter sp.]
MAIFYNDPQPDEIFYQGLAWMKLNNITKANNIFSRFIQLGNEHSTDKVQIHYFAGSLPDLLVLTTTWILKTSCIVFI